MTLRLLHELEQTGVRLLRDGGDLRVFTRRAVSVEPYRERIARHKPALLVALRGPDDPLLMPDDAIIASEAVWRSREEMTARVALLDERARRADATDTDAEVLRVWQAILHCKDHPMCAMVEQSPRVSHLPDPWVADH